MMLRKQAGYSEGKEFETQEKILLDRLDNLENDEPELDDTEEDVEEEDPPGRLKGHSVDG